MGRMHEGGGGEDGVRVEVGGDGVRVEMGRMGEGGGGEDG